MNVQRIHLAVTPSTSTALRQWADAHHPDAETLVLLDADEQTDGRGQRGNHWESAPGKNLTFSMACQPHFLPPDRQFLISQAIAIAVCESLTLLADGFTVKWPNDIYWHDSKVSGTLIECDLQGKHIGTCIIGTGINVNQTHFLSNAPNPVSLRQILGHGIDREQLLADVLHAFVQRYEQIRQGGADELRGDYMAHLYRAQGLHPYADADGPFLAAIDGILPTGHLILRRPDGQTKRYEFKEVRFLPCLTQEPSP